MRSSSATSKRAGARSTSCSPTRKVADLLLVLPKYGPVKVDKLLSRCRIAPSRTIGGLSARQRDELAVLLAGRTPGRDGPITGS